MALKNLPTTLSWAAALALGCGVILARSAYGEDEPAGGDDAPWKHLQGIQLPGALKRLDRPHHPSAPYSQAVHDKQANLAVAAERSLEAGQAAPTTDLPTPPARSLVRRRKRVKQERPQRATAPVQLRAPRQLALPLLAGHNPFLGLHAISAATNQQHGPLVTHEANAASVGGGGGWVGSLPYPLNELGNAGLKMTLAKPDAPVQESALSELAAEANVWPVQLKLSGKFH